MIIKHSYREANKCADALANHVCQMEEDFLMFEQVPSFLAQLLPFDTVRAASPRLVSV